MRVPRPWLLLALLSLCRARPDGAEQCHPGELRHLWAGDTKCCELCPEQKDKTRPCETIPDHDCKCPEGSSCADSDCWSCVILPQCEPGWERRRRGIIHFTFKCQPCRNGTYSNIRNGRCRNWADCESSGFVTLRPGNSTHNSECGSPGRAPEPAGPVLAAAAVFVLLLLTLGLHLCLCWRRRERKIPPGDLGSNFPPRLIQGEESWSIQFPEEEHGDKTAEEKLSVLSLNVYSELK